MPDETREVQYDEGEESLVLEDGQIAERGKPVTVSADLAVRLCEQSIWWDLSVGKEAEAQREAEEHEAKVAEAEAAKPAITEETAPQPPVTAGPAEPVEDTGADGSTSNDPAPKTPTADQAAGEKTPEAKESPVPQRPAPTAATTSKTQRGAK